MSPSGPPVMTYCMRAEAPGRSGWLSAILPVSSSHSWVRYLLIVAPRGPWSCARDRRQSAADALAHPREEVVLGSRRVDQAARQHVVVVGVDLAGDLRGQPEPERRRRVDLGGVGEQGLAPDLVEVAADVDASRDAVILRRPVEPLLAERRLEPELDHLRVNGLDAR